MRFTLLALFIAACATPADHVVTDRVRKDLCCTEASGDDENACIANGCKYGPEWSCGGVARDMTEWNAAAEACRLRCVCMCPADEEACINAP
jgi:hypothetical protein